jgi:hypothetical protein
MVKLLNNKILTIANFSILIYFSLLYFFDYFKIDFVLIGVLREIFTIPFLLAQFIFLVLGVIHIIKHKTYLLTCISIILLAINTIYTVGSFFKYIYHLLIYICTNTNYAYEKHTN